MLVIATVPCLLSLSLFLSKPPEGCALWLWHFLGNFIYIGIKHGFSCINIRQVPREVLKTEAEGRGFQHLPRDLANDYALKNHVRSLHVLLHKNWKHLLHFALFPALFCFAFSPMSREPNFHWLYMLVTARSYWKLRSRALTARELPC